MPHSPLKNAVVSLLLVATVAVNVVQVPVVFADSFFAVDEKASEQGLLGENVKDAKDLVAIVVDEEAWNDGTSYDGLSAKYSGLGGDTLKSRVQRYAQDVQKSLAKTNTLIIPVSRKAETVLKLTQVLQKLYLQGEENSSLVGMVAIGDVPLPVVNKGSQSFISMLPYTDFVDPMYVFDAGGQKFTRSVNSPSDPKPEIWHGVIHPPMGGVDGMKQLAEYLDKNHLYHIGDKNFTQFQKKVLVSDLVRESNNMNHESFPRYQTFLKDFDDIANSRYSAKWLAALQKKFDGEMAGKMGNSPSGPSGEFGNSESADSGAGAQSGTGPAGAGLADLPDIQSVQPIMQYHLQYPELFGTFLTTVSDYVTGSGRWGEDDVESLPSLIGKKDLFAMQTMKSINDTIEAKIDSQLEKVQKPLPLYSDVKVQGVVRYQVTGALGVLQSIAATLAGQHSSQDFSIGNPVFSFVNNSLIGGKQYVNGVAFDDISHAQQCSMYGGSTAGELGNTGSGGIKAFPQMVKFLRSLNPLTIHVSSIGGGPSDDSTADPRLLPTLGVTTHMMTQDGASVLTKGAFLHGAVVDKVYASVPLTSGDVLLDIDGVAIDETRSIDVVLNDHEVGQQVTVHLYRPGASGNSGAEQKVPVALLDANSDAWVAGCYGLNYGNEQAGKKSRCFPQAATVPVADHAGTARVASTTGLSDMDLGRSCTSFMALPMFGKFIQNTQKFLSDVRSNSGSPVYPTMTSQDPSKILLIDKDAANAPQNFTFQQFLDLQGEMNQKDDNGDYYDTNSNGKVDQTAWIDYNHNGKLDLWVSPLIAGGEVNVFPVVASGSLSVGDYKQKFPQLFKGSTYIGPYTGEFVGGDFGVDDPSEVGFGYKAAGASEREKWGNIEKDFLERDSAVTYATPRRAPTKQEYRSHILAMEKNNPTMSLTTKLLNILYAGDACVETGVSCADEAAQVENLRKQTSDIWMQIGAANKVKDISSVSFRKEPTPETLSAQFKGIISSGLPIDKPRRAEFLDKSGVARTFVYPNIFEASSLEDYLAKLGDAEKNLATYGAESSGLLTGGVGTGTGPTAVGLDVKKIQSVIDWRSLSLEAKHTKMLQEYLNPDIDAFVDDSTMGYEATYFVANGKPTYYTSDFSGESLVDEDDQQYLGVAGGDTVRGGGVVVAKPGVVTVENAAQAEIKTGTETKSGIAQNAAGVDIVPLSDWFTAMNTWIDDLKTTFKPLGLSVSGGTQDYDKVVKDGKPTASLKLSIASKILQTHGDSMSIDILAFDSDGKLASDDHSALVRLDGTGLTNGASISPDSASLPQSLIGGSYHPGVFLNDGKANFQLISADGPATVVLRAHAFVNGKDITSDSVTMTITDMQLRVEPDTSVLSLTDNQSTSVTVRLTDGSGKTVAQDMDASVSAPDLKVSAKTVHITKGVGVFTVSPSGKTGTSDILVSPVLAGGSGGGSMLAQKISVNVIGGSPKQVSVGVMSTTLTSGGAKQTVTLGISDEKNNPVEDQSVEYDVKISGPATVSSSHVSSAGGLSSVDVVSGTGAGSAVLQITAHLEDGSTLSASKTITIRSDLHVDLSSNVPILPADGASQAVMTATVRDGSGVVVSDYSGPVSFSIDQSDQSGGATFTSQTPKAFSGGKAIITLRAGTHAGDMGIAAATASLSAHTKITLHALAPNSIQITGGAKSLATMDGGGSGSTSTSLIFNVVDQFGNLSTDTSLPLTVRITAKTQKYGDVLLGNNKTAKDGVAYAQHGLGAVSIASTRVAGPIHVVICSPNLSCASYEIITSGRTGIGTVASFNPATLYVSMLGGPFGKVSEQNYLAGGMLFNGKTQAVAAVTTDVKPRHRLLTLGAYGGLSLQDKAAQISVEASAKDEPLRVSLATDLGKTTAGTLLIKQSGISLLSGGQDLKSVAGKAGIFVTDVHDAATSYSVTQDASGVNIRDGQSFLARVNLSGGIEMYDSRVHAQVSDGSASGQYLSVDIFVGTDLVARSQIQFDAVNSVALLEAMPGSLQTLPVGVWLVNAIHSGDSSFESTYTGFSSEEPMGYTLTDTTSTDVIGTGETSLEDALSTSGVGFSGDNKHMLLLAAGNTVGEAHLSYASEIGIVLGDPTVRLIGENDTADTGFTRDLGQQIGHVTDGAKVLLPIDVNGDGKKDLLVGSDTGKIRYFQYVGGSQKFRDRGDYLDVKNGILDATVADVNGDSHDDIVVAAKESCTKKESCVDVYMHTGGNFIRQNIGLQIGSDRRVVVMRVVDLNGDGLSDLLVSLDDGTIRAFYNSHSGGFATTGQLIGNFSVAAGQKVLLTASTKITNSIPSNSGVNVGAGGSDAFADIFAQPEGGSASTLVYFVSDPAHSVQGGNVSYVRVEAPVKQISQEDASKKLSEDLAASLAPKSINPKQTALLGAGGSNDPSLKVASTGMNILTRENGKDANGNGIPDYLDTTAGGGAGDLSADGIISSVKSTINKLRCGPACFPMPINFAFLAPGDINVNGTSYGKDPLAIPVFGAAGAGCGEWVIWPGCSYKDAAMNFRLYVSPTTTGQIGFGICVGSAFPDDYPSNSKTANTGAKCYAFAPNISLIPKGLCKAVADNMSAVLKNANSLGTGTGFTSLIAGGGKSFTSDTSNTHIVTGNSGTDLLLPYKAEINVAKNIRVPGFPKAFTDWLDKQIEEIVDKLTDLPDLTIMYPQLNSFGSAVTPHMPTGQIKSYSSFLSFLNSIPLIAIDPKPVAIVVPTLTKGQILKFQANLDRFGEDFNMELLRVKGIFGCSKATKDKRFVDICASIDVNANAILQKVNHNFQTLNQYKDFPRQLLEYRLIETKYIGQIINYLNGITNFVGGYVKRQQTRLASWLNVIKSIKKALATWQSVIDVTQKYAANCDSCKTDRNSLFPVLLQMFVNIPTPPVIAFPKWPDIVMDFSRVETGVHITWPDLSFTPKQILIPNLPSVHLPIDIGALGGLLNAGDLSKITLNLNKAFDSMIPSLPELPTLPVLPKLPDLPALPAFKLPDLPPAPSIPSLDMIKGVNLAKSLGTIKNLLEIVCLVKKGYVVVNENSLKTEIEALTQRSVFPPLAIDLAETVTYPQIKYNAVDQVIVKSRLRFDLQTDAIYNLFKHFADSMNATTTDLVKGENALSQSRSKSLQKAVQPGVSSFVPASGSRGSQKIHLVAEQYMVDPATLPVVAGSSDVGSSASTQLRDHLMAYQGEVNRDIASLESESGTPGGESTDSGTGSKTSLLTRLVAQASQSDSMRVSKPVMVAQVTGVGNGNGNKGSASRHESVDSPALASQTEQLDLAYKDYAESQSQPIGLYIQHPKSGMAEKLIDYSLEMSRDPLMTDGDADGDDDSDIFYSFGGDIYFKENSTSAPDDAFTAFSGSSLGVKTLDDLAPAAPAPYGITVDDSQNQSMTISWNTAGDDLGGYELVYWNTQGVAHRKYLYDSASGNIPYNNDDTTVEKITQDSSQTISLSLPNGNTYFQIIPLRSHGQAGTPSEVHLLAPQACGDTTPPLTSFAGGAGGTGTDAAGADGAVASDGSITRNVAIGKSLQIDMSKTVDLKSTIESYFADLDLAKDSDPDHDGDPTNDHDVTSPSAMVTIGPFNLPGQKKVKVFAENASGLSGGQVVNINVYVPDIVLKDVVLKEGTAYGYVTPGEPQMPLSLVRERGGVSTVIGDYQTDSQGNFFISNLQTQGTTVIRNAKNEIVAEYESATGQLKAVKNGYSIRAVISDATRLVTVQLVDNSSGLILANMFAVPDVNTDTTVDPAGLQYTPVTVSSMKGVHLKDTAASDGISFKKIPANDPQFFGGTEIVDVAAGKRLAVVDSSAHVYALDSRFSVRLKAVVDMPYVYELLMSNVVIGNMFVASVLPKSPTVLDPKEFAIGGSAVAQILPEISATPANTFSDIPSSSPLYDAVNTLQQDGIVQGYQENGQQLFKPDQKITRAEFTKIVLKSLCIEPRPLAYLAPSPFNDVAFANPLAWFYPWVKESFLRSLITGYLGEKDAAGLVPYRPLSNISRAESAKILIEALKMLQILRLVGVDTTPGKDEVWYSPYLRISQNLAPYLSSPSSTSAPYIVTSNEARTPNLEMTRGDFALMASRVLKIHNCYSDVEAKNQAATDAQAQAKKKAAQDALDKANAAARAELQKKLAGKTSQLPSGIYIVLADCNACPCVSSIDSTGQLLPGDRVFAILSTPDHATIFRKSNVFFLPPTMTSPPSL